ncbi:MAG TPA: hypothetical protein DEB40_13150 [Elusimicrobia bacterium]|nr:hypothetical protein [Elusimicrobiota bacterium]HBT62682.1 hypothetical protein [Elusimicrobiota bacterium]
MIRRVKSFMSEMPQFYVLLFGLAWLAAIWDLDLHLGAGLGVFLLYLVPVGLVVWYVGGAWAVIMPVLAAAAAWQADVSSRDIFAPPHDSYWEAAARLCCYLVISHLLVLRRHRAAAAPGSSSPGLRNQ